MENESLFVVGIGASAGGWKAIEDFFNNVQPDDRICYIIVQHISPDYENLLKDLLINHSKLKICYAEEKLGLSANTIYVVPSKKDFTLKGGKIELKDKLKHAKTSSAIDQFFTSLAKSSGQRSIAVILSGNGTDGTLGVAAIKAAGGQVIIQDPETAKFKNMPLNAIASGYADKVLSPQDMPGKILEIISLKNKQNYPEALTQIIELINNQTGMNFGSYKLPTLRRRLSRRMQLLKLDDLDDYLAYLKTNEKEIKKLGEEFLIHVTEFFRDKQAFEFMESHVIPEIIKDKHNGDIIKILVVGCSTGQEAYSIAIVLNEALLMADKTCEIKIFATDVDDKALTAARNGSYPLSIEKQISGKLLSKYFSKDAKGYKVNPELRKSIIFTNHDLTKEFPFGKMDLVSCRNVLIYFNATLQQKMLSVLQFILKVDGYLFLGPSETLGEFEPNFSEENKKWKFFKKNSLAVSFSPSLIYNAKAPVLAPIQPATAVGTLPSDVLESINNAILEVFKYSGVLLDENLNVLKLIGDCNKFLHVPEHLNFNLMDMVSEDLGIALSTATGKALKEKEDVFLRHVNISENEKTRLVNVIVKLTKSKGQINKNLLVLFQESAESIDNIKFQDYEKEKHVKDFIFDIQEKLRITSQKLQAMVEALETTNEELQSTNEEVISSNEELQSANEELQSLNEELQIVNQNLKIKIEELTVLNDDLDNYFRVTEISQIFVDNDLNLRRFTPVSTQHINFLDSDIGRPISHFSTNIKFHDFITELKKVVKNAAYFEKEVETNEGKWFLMKIIPYLKKDRKVDGAIITFIDITSAHTEIDKKTTTLKNELQNSALSLRRSNEELEQFAHIVAHELQEPLRSITLFVDKIVKSSQGQLSKIELADFERVKDSAKRMRELIQDVQYINELGKNKTPHRFVSLNELIKEALLEMEEEIKKSRAKVLVRSLPEVKGEAFQIKQMFRQLISNAIKFSKRNVPPVITITSKGISGSSINKDLKNKKFCMICVKDNGIGFDEAYLEKIFTLFQRLHYKNEYKGTGIGLAMCRKVMQNHHGFLTATSRLDEGSTFMSVFPVFPKLKERTKKKTSPLLNIN